MKKILFILIALVSNSIINAQNLKLNSSSVINNLDTVVFDISQAVTQGNTVAFPVSFLSDDTINALDFSFLFNMTDFSYDTILDLTNYMTTLSFMGFDQRVRFTSYSFQNYTNDTALASIRFNVLTGQQFCDTDLDSIKIYLNGDPCALKVITCVPNAINEIDNANAVDVYPNPANQILSISSAHNAAFQLADINGKVVIDNASVVAKQKQEIKTGSFAEGVYILKVFNEQFTTFQKVVISR